MEFPLALHVEERPLRGVALLAGRQAAQGGFQVLTSRRARLAQALRPTESALVRGVLVQLERADSGLEPGSPGEGQRDRSLTCLFTTFTVSNTRHGWFLRGERGTGREWAEREDAVYIIHLGCNQKRNRWIF
ncbi:hypothetical protein EYF80_065643 [Liparis tanakae]|uniref:Uncharacterized protein n=1 Tax=Liparis tanakae TaxID=230148 RepID=A0A4Z2E6L8_9TELE|nr:hypothetical protein EYF80_065643 [Liparis tanakae]